MCVVVGATPKGEHERRLKAYGSLSGELAGRVWCGPQAAKHSYPLSLSLSLSIQAFHVLQAAARAL